MANAPEDRKAFYQTLARKMTFLIVVVSFLPMTLTTAILFSRFHEAYTKKIEAHISELVQKHTQNIDTFLSEKLGNIRYLSTIFKGQADDPHLFLSTQLKLLKKEYGDVFTDLGLINEQGVQFAYEGPFRLANADYSKADWFIRAKDRSYFISDVFAGLRGHPHFIITVKVQSGDSQFILRSTINFAAFNSLVENIHIGRTGTAFIINGAGQFQTKTDALLDKDAVHSILNYRGVTKKTALFSKSLNIPGVPFLCITSAMQNIDWLMVFRQDMDDAFQDLRSTRLLTLVIFVIGCTAILFVAYALPKKIIRLLSSADQRSEAMNRQVIESGRLATIGELAAGIAHEINNPVAIMVEEAGWIEDLLEDENLKKAKNLEEFKRALLQINIQGKRCKEITHKLLSFARKTDSQANDVQINDAIMEIVALTEQMAKYNKVCLTTHLENGIPCIRVSPSEIQQVVLNIINNAIDAMEKSGGTIKIETGLSKIKKNHLIISIEDDGPGIPKDNLDRIFDPFFTTKAVGKGTGLGLSICYGIIQKMGGSIEVGSQVEIGTKFRIWLPFQEETDQKDISTENKIIN